MQRCIYYTYILTNASRSVLYTGVTNNLSRRLVEHWIGKPGSFTTRYRVQYLLWQESTRYVLNAIEREKEIKRMTRAQKVALLLPVNPDWEFLNQEWLNQWPPTPEQIAEIMAFWHTSDQDALFYNGREEQPDADAEDLPPDADS